MGMLYKQQEKYDRAIDAYLRCLGVREKLLGPAHPETIAVRHNIGELYNAWGKPDEGKPYLETNIKYMNEINEQQKKLKQNHKHHHDGKECNDPSHHHHHDHKCDDPTHNHDHDHKCDDPSHKHDHKCKDQSHHHHHHGEK